MVLVSGAGCEHQSGSVAERCLKPLTSDCDALGDHVPFEWRTSAVSQTGLGSGKAAQPVRVINVRDKDRDSSSASRQLVAWLHCVVLRGLLLACCQFA